MSGWAREARERTYMFASSNRSHGKKGPWHQNTVTSQANPCWKRKKGQIFATVMHSGILARVRGTLKRRLNDIIFFFCFSL